MEFLMWRGRAFHTLGPETANAWSPSVFLFVRGTSSISWLLSLVLRLYCFICIMSHRYAGPIECNILKTSSAILKTTLFSIGNK